MKKNGFLDLCPVSGLAEIQEIIQKLLPDQRAALCEWLNGYEGNALIFLNPSDACCEVLEEIGDAGLPRLI